MERFDGTAARQLNEPRVSGQRVSGQQVCRVAAPALSPRLRLVEQDIYAELTRRRRRAQIAARRWVDAEEPV